MRGVRIQVQVTTEPLKGLVQAIPTNDTFVEKVACVSYSVRENSEGCDVMRLEVVLDVNAVNHTFRGEISASIEKCEESLNDKTPVVGAPDHCRKVCRIGVHSVRIFTVNNCSVCLCNIARIDTACQESPIWGTTASRET